MKIKTPLIILLLISNFLLLACTSSQLETLVDLEDEYVNQQVKLFTPDQFNTYETISPVVLEIRYYANVDIVFPNNYNVRIFQETRKGWAEIREKPILRLPADDIVFSTKTETTAVRLVTIYPELSDYARSYNLRFYIFGNMEDGQEIQQVAAYVDVKLNP